ncbi:gamma-soluble NSF attachment protein [Paragonimus westermani]|uniref:Gamma-soluble NSF attachment protein n=1 Tax=Paragonimus westermani TaxID=34504 RepID=A0A5J4NBB1_9TREM|nr:gamma-soluble NSF attachment protein [Paragonimus westermani]
MSDSAKVVIGRFTGTVEDKYHEAADHFNSAARVWVRLHRFEKAEKALRSYIDCIQLGNPDSTAATIGGFSDSSAVPNLCARAVVVLILIKLHLGDEVAAKKVYSEAVAKWCFLETDENHSVKQLISAYEDRDSDAFAVAIKASCFRLLDLDYVRLIKEIKLTPSRESKAKERQSQAHSGTSPGLIEHESPSKNDSGQVSSAHILTSEAFEDKEDEIEEDIC